MELEYRKVQTQHVVPGEVLEAVPDLIAAAMRLTLQRHVLVHRLASYEAFYEVPANWWQHLRSQLGMEHETKTKVVRVERFRSYPDSEVVLPQKKFGQPVVFEVATPWNLR